MASISAYTVIAMSTLLVTLTSAQPHSSKHPLKASAEILTPKGATRELLWEEVARNEVDYAFGKETVDGEVFLIADSAIYNRAPAQQKEQDYDGRIYTPLPKYPTWSACKADGYWWLGYEKGVKCWRQVYTSELAEDPRNCPLSGGQTKRYCLAAGCEWEPLELWRCKKTLAQMQRDAVPPLHTEFQDGYARCKMTLVPMEYMDVTKEQCEELEHVWVPLPMWSCWSLTFSCVL